MKLRSGFHLFLPILLLLLLAMAACAQDEDSVSGPSSLPAPAPTEAARPLTDGERAAIAEFDSQLESINAQWEQFYSDLDDWRAGLAACHPNAAQESLASFVGAYAAVVEGARDLPRTSSTKAMADLAITAAEAEETALRQLRDRWRAGNISLFESVEQRRAESVLAQNSATDSSLELRTQYEEGLTFDEVAEMEKFSESFDVIADDWDNFHDAYDAFAKRESKLDEEERAAGYELLVAQLDEIMSSIDALEVTGINKDLIDKLEEAAEDEVAALQFLADFPPELTSEDDVDSGTPTTSAPAATPDAAQPAPVPLATAAPPAANGEATTDPAAVTAAPSTKAATGTAQAATTGAKQAAEGDTAPTKSPTKKLSPLEEMAYAISSTQTLLPELGESIDGIVNDQSAESLVDLDKFDAGFRRYVSEWGRFYRVYDEWRATDGGCDRVEVAADLMGFNQQAEALARTVRVLPQSGLLVPLYSLTVEAAERESGAIRTLANSWTPFAVDAFKAVDEERVAAGRLRRQAGIALEELRNRP